jgi:hypothetical protein
VNLKVDVKLVFRIAGPSSDDLPPRGAPRAPRGGPARLNVLAAGRCVPKRAGASSDVASWMLMGRPSNGTPLYCFIALTASLRRSNTTSAVPEEK